MTPNEEKAQKIGKQWAISMFAMYLNPENRGPSFRWAKFDAIVAKFVRANVPGSFPERTWKQDGDKLLKLALDAAKLQSKVLLQRSAVAKWMGLEGDK